MTELTYIVERHADDGRVLARWRMPAECVEMALDADGLLDHYELERLAWGSCDGSSSCDAGIHVHGCRGDLAGYNCDSPGSHG